MNKALEKLKIIQELCTRHNIKISTAESCTGGSVSKLITDQSGSSDYYNGSIIAYSNQVKVNILKVPQEDIIKYGAVSEEVSFLMAQGLLNIIDCNIAISATGIMEKGKAKDSKNPQVFITTKSDDHHISSHYYLHGNRDKNRQNTTNHALDCLYDFIHKNYLVS